MSEHTETQEIDRLRSENSELRRLSEMRHGSIAKAVFETVTDHAATWDTASDELIWMDPAIDCANEKEWKVSETWLAECCKRFPQWAERLRDFSARWNESNTPTDEELAAIDFEEIDEDRLNRSTRQALNIMRFYSKLQRVEADRDALRERCKELAELLWRVEYACGGKAATAKRNETTHAPHWSLIEQIRAALAKVKP